MCCQQVFRDRLQRSFLLALILCALAPVSCLGQGTWTQETDRLAALLHWHAGSVVAEIGAGNGKLTVEAAERVGPSGKVYTTELDPDRLVQLKELADKQRNLTVIEAGQATTNLPAACCDSIFMRLVYHHLTQPAEIDASLFQALKPGGRLAVIDEEPRKGTEIPPGVPKNRLGHGVPQKVLIREVTAAGFRVESVSKDWPGRDVYHAMYCVVFLKPKS